MTLFLLSTFLLGMDWNQSRTIVNDPYYNETNSLINKYGVDKYFITAIATNTIVGYTLPKKQRNIFWTYVSFTEATYVAGNYSIGVRIKL